MPAREVAPGQACPSAGAAPAPDRLDAHGLTGWCLQTFEAGRSMPWQNGGGITTELFRQPDPQGVAPFEWRVSLAHVASSGPFSAFPGVDRILGILTGGSLHLSAPLWPAGALMQPVTRPGTGRAAPDVGASLDEATPAPLLAFPGEAAVDAQLLGGPLLDFNLMGWRERWRIQAEVQGPSADGVMPGPWPASIPMAGWRGWLALSDGLFLAAASPAPPGQHRPVMWPKHSLLWCQTPEAAPPLRLEGSGGAWIAIQVNPAV